MCPQGPDGLVVRDTDTTVDPSVPEPPTRFGTPGKPERKRLQHESGGNCDLKEEERQWVPDFVDAVDESRRHPLPWRPDSDGDHTRHRTYALRPTDPGPGRTSRVVDGGDTETWGS